MLFLLDRVHRDGFFNMALDELLAREVESGRLEAFVRIYGWNPPAVSLGRNQRADEVDVAACQRDGVDVVRRPTGGRAVYHRDELTYSLAARYDHPLFGGSTRDAYHAIARGLCRGLRILGVSAELVRTPTKLGQSMKPPHALETEHLIAVGRSPACFATSGRDEVAARGRKIVGSAQRRFGRSFLQQGSVLLCQAQDHHYFRRPAPPDSFTTVERELGRPVSFEEAAQAMGQGMTEEWGIQFIRTLPESSLVETAMVLAQERREAGFRPAPRFMLTESIDLH